jgi:hypothetical protein
LPKSFTLTPSKALLAAALRGNPPRVAWTRALTEDARRAMRDERVGPLVAARRPAGWPDDLLADAARDARASAVLELAQRRELDRVTRALAERGIAAAVFKGAALAYTVYADPSLRPREDTDLLIEHENVAAAGAALAAIGYREDVDAGGEVSTHQRHWSRVDGGGLRHACDVHWRAANPHVFASAVSTAALIAGAVPAPAVGNALRVVNAEDALLIAAMHRVAHHDGSDLLWLYDVHLIAESMSADQARAVCERASSAGMGAVLAAALMAARTLFDTPLGDAAVAWCASSVESSEPSAAFLRGDLRAADVMWSDLRAIGGWRSRLRLIRERLFPPAAYMHARAGSGAIPLPLLYARRLWRGVPRWLSR